MRSASLNRIDSETAGADPAAAGRRAAGADQLAGDGGGRDGAELLELRQRLHHLRQDARRRLGAVQAGGAGAQGAGRALAHAVLARRAARLPHHLRRHERQGAVLFGLGPR
eukprot:2442450-Rhodomonas_salina.1